MAGYMLMGVKPGMVLISLTTQRPSGVKKKSQRPRPDPSTASKARIARARSRSISSSGSSAGQDSWVLPVSWYFDSKS